MNRINRFRAVTIFFSFQREILLYTYIMGDGEIIISFYRRIIALYAI